MDQVLLRNRWIIRRRLEGWEIPDIATALRVSEEIIGRSFAVHRKEKSEGLQVGSGALTLSTRHLWTSFWNSAGCFHDRFGYLEPLASVDGLFLPRLELRAT